MSKANWMQEEIQNERLRDAAADMLEALQFMMICYSALVPGYLHHDCWYKASAAIKKAGAGYIQAEGDSHE